MNFLEDICLKAKSDKKTIVLPEGYDLRTIKAASIISKEGIANVILLGNPSKIYESSEDTDLSGITIIEPTKSEYYEDFVNTFYEMRKHKGITLEQAKEYMTKPLYFGVMLVKKSYADGMVAGALNSTSDTLRPALQILKTAPGNTCVSSFFVMETPNKDLGENGLMVFSDCAIVENPNSEQLSEIAIAAAASFKALVHAEPKVAMLSYSTYGSAKSVHTEKVVEATRIAKAKAPELCIDGELQLDSAIVPSVNQKKAPGSPIEGKANVLVFPDLNAGNIGYKLVQRFANANAYGPVCQGLAKPVNDLSRGCSIEDIVGVVAITAVQAQMEK